MVWAWMQWKPYVLGTRERLWFGHGCEGQRMLLEHERCYRPYVLAAGRRLWFGHGCKGNRMLVEQQGDYGLASRAQPKNSTPSLLEYRASKDFQQT